jgi:hypothetical protein
VGVLARTLGEQKLLLVSLAEGEAADKRRVVLVMARQHPGETPASFVL